MKVLLVHNYYRGPGGEDSVFHRERGMLRSAGHEVVEYSRTNDEIVEHGILRKVDLAGRTLWARDSERQLRGILRNEKPHIAHFHNTFPLISPAAYYACQEAGVPVVQSLHNARLMCPAATFYRHGQLCQECLGRTVPWPGVIHSCYHNSYLHTATVAGMVTFHKLLGTWQQSVNAYIAFTESFRQMFVAAGLPSEKIFVKPHFLNVDPGMKEEPGAYGLFLGRLTPEKGVSTLLQAWALLRSPIPLRIVGEGPARAALEEQKERAQLANVRFEGWLSQEDVRAALKTAAFLVFPSELYEPFGLAIVEAFACGVPVIGSRLGAILEIIEDRKTGLHFTPGDATDLASKVEWAWSHTSEMHVMGKAARLEYETKYTAKRNYQLLMRIYNQASNLARKAA